MSFTTADRRQLANDLKAINDKLEANAALLRALLRTAGVAGTFGERTGLDFGPEANPDEGDDRPTTRAGKPFDRWPGTES